MNVLNNLNRLEEQKRIVFDKVEKEIKALKKTAKQGYSGKINHKKTVVDDITFDSKMESEYYRYLKALKEHNLIKDFSRQPEYILQDKFIIVDGEIIYGNDERFNKLKRKTKAETIRAIKYRGDFLVEELDGTVYVVDTKGISTTEFEIKRKMFICKNPTLSLKVLIKRKEGWVDFYENKKKVKAKKKAKSA